jgi:rod shape determining protein RodA
MRNESNWGSKRLHIVAFLLLAIGLVNQYSASATSSHFSFYRQLVFSGVGIAIYVFILRYANYRLLGRLAWIFWGLGLLALALVPLIGVSAGGSQRWISLGAFRFQPSEIAKMTTLLAIAAAAGKRDQRSLRFTDLFTPLIIVGPPCLLILLQPDLGTAGSLGIAALLTVLFTGVKPKVAVLLLAISISGTVAAWNFGLKPYQKSRVITALNPEKSASGSGYQAVQSKLSIASGGLTGSGPMQGYQSQGDYLPEQHTDFAFSVWAEEWGLIGSLVVVLLFGWLLIEMTEIAYVAKESLGTYIAIASASYVAVALWINLFMVLAMFPTVGLALPFFTYGGTHTITLALTLGITQNVFARKNLF